MNKLDIPDYIMPAFKIDEETLNDPYTPSRFPWDQIEAIQSNMKDEIIFLKKLSYLLYYIDKRNLDYNDLSDTAINLIAQAKEKYGKDLSGLKGE